MAKPFRTIKPSAGTPTVSRAKLAEAVRRVAAGGPAVRGAPAASLLQQASVIVATPPAATRRRPKAAGATP